MRANKQDLYFYRHAADDKVFDIFHTVNCQSTFVIFIIECRICRLQYVGKSETAFNLRLKNHRNHIERGINSCELSEHFLHNSRSHDFSKGVTITIIEQIKRSNMTIERKKEILRGREIFWQSQLNTLQPNGLAENTHDDHPLNILDPLRYLSIKQLKSPPASYVLACVVTVKFHGSHEQHFLHIRPSTLTRSKEQLHIVKAPMKRIFLFIYLFFTYF